MVNVGSVSANAGTDQIICLGQSANLTASGGVNYSWSNGAGTQSINVSPTQNTNYTVTVSDNNGCTASDAVYVTVNPLPQASAGPNKAICIGTSTTITASGGTTYAWSPSSSLSNAAIASPVANPTVTTTYTVTVTNNNGCSATSSMVITVNPLPQASAGSNNAICIGFSANLNASGGTSYVWSPSTSLSNATIANPVATPTVTTTYTVTVTNANTCSATSSMVLTVNALPLAEAGPNQSICIYNSTTLNATGGTAYAWSPAASLNNQNIANPVANPTVTTTYTVTVTNGNGCSSTDNMVLTVNPLPNANAGQDAYMCPHETVTLNATGGNIYLWSPATGLNNVNIANPTAHPSVTTTYTVQVTDANGCINTDNVVVNLYPLPPADAGNHAAICIGNSTVLNATGGTTYAWNTGDNTQAITVSPQTTSTYTVTVTDNNGCSATDNVIVDVNNLPPANAGNDFSICTGNTGNLNASGGVTYAWSPPNGLSNTNTANPVANPASQTTYTVTVTDANGCSQTDDVIVSIFPSPVINFIADNLSGCPPLIVNFTDNTTPAIQTWVWDFGDPQSGVFNNSGMKNPTHIYNTPGTYSVTLTVTTTDGCTKSLIQNNIIQVSPKPVADFTSIPQQTTLEAPIVQFLNNSYNAVSYYWNFGEPSSQNTSNLSSPVHIFQNEGTFTVMLYVTSADGCTDSTSGTIRILPTYSIFIPNAFTPNGDGINDYFRPVVTNIEEFLMLIYDRWGEMVYETDDILKPWDGHINNSMEIGTQDVYSCVIILKDFMGETHKYIGRVALIK
ncbi:MAG: PKD domain protein [Bacteroidetes bacterium ADurb.Bin408]|nr:MAG: PKD domain protein [Bacteroidetes bacterium ADurb.Bin408]